MIMENRMELVVYWDLDHTIINVRPKRHTYKILRLWLLMCVPIRQEKQNHE